MEDKARLIEELKNDSKYYIEMVFTIAKMNMAYLEALLEQGFTVDQAMKLVGEQTRALMGGKS